ncbi:MAG: creatininase family protein, partial [Oscillospiraceae bacterium]|nr:creatininase family protein [Oscillospiraceae bacterium]
MKSVYWWDYTSEELGELAPQSVVFQPVGSVEQHCHLPLGTDSLICRELASRLAAKVAQENYSGLFLPLLPYGKSNEHGNYPGTVTFSAQT